MLKQIVLAVASLIGAIIGAGVFALPYTLSKSGLLPWLFYFVVLGAVVLFLHSFLGEVVLLTQGRHRLPGYAGIYLGKRAKILVGVSTVAGTIGALLAYMILGGKFLSIIFPSLFNSFQWALVLWALLCLFVFLGIKSIAPLEFIMNLGLFAVIFIIFFFCLPKIEKTAFHLFDAKHLFLPFGVILFSLIGWSAVPEVFQILKEKRDIKKVIICSLLIALCFYLLFAFVISGVSGPLTSEEAFEGLLPFLGRKVLILGAIFGLLSVASSFLILGNYLKNTLVYDYRFPRFSAFFLVSALPLFLFLIGMRQFSQVIGLVGTFVGLIEGIAIALIYKKAKQKEKSKRKELGSLHGPLVYFIIAVLTLGALSQIVYYFV